MQNQKQVVAALLSPEAYPQETGEIELIQTHISFVFLTKDYVYKVKKAVDFGFLDFSTLEKRHTFCEKELQLNRRLCPEIYIEVVSINKSDTIKIAGTGETIEYALKMKRLPQGKLMAQLLKEGEVDKRTIGKIAKVVAKFHSNAQTAPDIDKYGSMKILKKNWDENFAQTKKYICHTILKKEFQFIQTRINDFMAKRFDLFENRVANKHIRDCHGDLHSGNIFVTTKICIFDAIEFNDRFRYSDIAADVAFLAMDLDFQQRKELANHFINKYLQYSKDQTLIPLLPFYKCYRAYVRGKVISFRLDDTNITTQEKISATNEAQAYFKLAVEYAERL
jgi:aminoglycoside phosphotransferase family enzyme